MDSLTEKEKRIYNSYLYHSRYGQPVKMRKDFSDMDQNTIVLLKKLSYFFHRYPHIDIDDFFKAPIVIHPNEQYPKLSSFINLSATKTYSLFKKQEEDADPEKQFDKIKEGFRFIGMFCLENKINIDQYPNYKTGYMHSWLNHYREHRINPYCLMEMNNIFSILTSLEKDEVELFAKNLNEKLVAYRTRYMNSNKTKELVREATKKIKEFLKKNLQ